MVDNFTKEKFTCFSEIVFNIFPNINYITLNNSCDGHSSNYYLKTHTNIKDRISINDDKNWEFISDEDFLNPRIYLKDISYKPKTLGTYIIERTQKTEPYKLSADILSLKLLPLMEFCNFVDVEIYSSSNYFNFRNGFNRLKYKFYYSDLKSNWFQPCIIRRIDMYPIVKMMFNELVKGKEK